MPLIILTEDGPLGKAGAQVWVNDPKDVEARNSPRKSQPHAAKKSDK